MVRDRFMASRAVSVAVASALVATALVAVFQGAAGAVPVSCPSSAVNEAAATAAAAACGGRVEVISERTEEAQTFANPNGSFTLIETLLPRYARRADGSWTTADATLRPNPDGSFSPTAPTFAMTFSGGGKARPLAVMDRDGARLELSWPAPLPAPSVSGSVATYAGVPVAGVDLQIRAGVAGFSTLFVVKTRQAGASPALSNLRFGLATDGLRLATSAGSGALRAVDRSGRVVFAAATPLMWDSSAGRTGAAAAQGMAEPRTAAMPARLQGGALTLTPDRAMLTDPATEYPVYIDPTFSDTRRNWTIVRKTFPNSSYWNTTSTATDDGWAGAVKVGFQDWEPAMTDRSLFQMRVGGLKGKVVDSAHFKLWQLWSSRPCGSTGSPVSLWTIGTISSSTTWNHQPAWSTKLGSTTAVHKYDQGGSCGPGQVAFDIRSHVQNVANNSGNYVYLGLRADNENDNGTWRRYQLNGDHVPYIEATYRSKPAVPNQLSSGGQACVTGAARPLAAANPISLGAMVSDADGGTVTATFQTAQVNANGTYTAWTALGDASTASGQPVDKDWGGLTHGQAYVWRVMATDPTGLTSLWSGPCEFVASAVDPPIPTVTSPDGSYPEQPVACAGGPGTTGRFQFTPNSPDVTKFRYRWNDGQPVDVPVTAGQSITISLTPPSPDPMQPTLGGPSHLHVTSINTVDQPSDEYDYGTLLCDAAAESGRWTMSEGSGTTLADSSGNGRDLTFSAGTWTSAANQHIPGEQSISLAPPTSASTDDVGDTTSSFTMSAWLRTTNATAWQLAVSQGLRFQVGLSAGQWRLQMHTRATLQQPMTVAAASGGTVRLGIWTHVAGVYDAANGSIRLYVNGQLAATQVVLLPVGSTGLSVGVGQVYQGGINPYATHHFSGDVDDVRAWPRVVSDAEIRGLGARLAGAWGFEEGPETAFDAGPYARDAAWVNPWVGSVQVPGHSDELGTPGGSFQAVGLDGTTASLDTAGVVARTDQSLTVSAWVKRSSSATAQGVVVGQVSGLGPTAWKLNWDPAANRWRMAILKADGSTWYTASANGTVTANTWYHLVGVYDAQAGEVRLYVGVGASPPALQTTKATGVGATAGSIAPYAMGKVGNGLRLKGTLDDVVVFAGVVPESVITNPSDPLWQIWS